MCFLWIQKKNYLLTFSKFFLKTPTLQAFNCKKSVSLKISKVRLLSSFSSQNTLATFFRFISSVFSLCTESSIVLLS